FRDDGRVRWRRPERSVPTNEIGGALRTAATNWGVPAAAAAFDVLAEAAGAATRLANRHRPGFRPASQLLRSSSDGFWQLRHRLVPLWIALCVAGGDEALVPLFPICVIGCECGFVGASLRNRLIVPDSSAALARAVGTDRPG